MGLSRLETIGGGTADFVLRPHTEPIEIRTQPSMGIVVPHMSDAVGQTAIEASIHIRDVYKTIGSPLPEAMRKKSKKSGDNKATDVLEECLNLAPFGVNMIACEGAKEGIKFGKEHEVKVLSGRYGGLNPTLGDIAAVGDPIEKTDEYTRLGNATSFVGGDADGNLPFMPDEKTTDVKYMRRVITSSDLRGIDPEMKMKDVFDVAKRNVGIVNPDQMTVIALNRPRNYPLIEDAKAAGVNLVLIESGDFIPGVYAACSKADMSAPPEKRRVYYSGGAGGVAEGLGAILVARLLGGESFLSFEKGDGTPSEQFPELKALRDWLPGDPKKLFMCIASMGIEPEWFNLPGVKERINGERRYIVPIINITSDGVTTSELEYRRIYVYSQNRFVLQKVT